MDPLDVARRFVEARFPDATTAVVAGSTARGERTTTSDIDLLLVGPRTMLAGADSLAPTYAVDGEVLEVFAYTPAGFEAWATAGVAQYRPVIVHMLLEGVPLRGGAELDVLRARWRPVIDAGPTAGPGELDHLRYVVTDLLDDLVDATDPLERRIVAATLLEKITTLLLLNDHRWIGVGKHAARRLREWDPARAERLVAPFLADDPRAFADAVSVELDTVGGRLQDGYVRRAQRVGGLALPSPHGGAG